MQQIKTGLSANPTRSQNVQCTYDAVGNVKSLSDAYAGGAVSFSYDALDLLMSAQTNVANNGLFYLLTDHLGSTSVTTDASGNKVAELQYYPYGQTRYSWNLTPTSHRFTGQISDEDSTGLYFFNARYYDGLLGRFISADMVVPEPGNPQALNRYSFVYNNPLKYTDSSGHMPTDGCQYEGCTTEKTDDSSWYWTFDSQPLADSLPGTSQQYADAATALDGAALASDIVAEGIVLTLAAVGAFGTSVEGTPVAGPAGAYAGYWMGQIAVRPIMFAGNVLASGATILTGFSEAKTGASRIQADISLGADGVQADFTASAGSGTQIGVVTTGLGWLAPLSEASLTLQSVAVAADLGWVSSPYGPITIGFHFP